MPSRHFRHQEARDVLVVLSIAASVTGLTALCAGLSTPDPPQGTTIMVPRSARDENTQRVQFGEYCRCHSTPPHVGATTRPTMGDPLGATESEAQRQLSATQGSPELTLEEIVRRATGKEPQSDTTVSLRGWGVHRGRAHRAEPDAARHYLLEMSARLRRTTLGADQGTRDTVSSDIYTYYWLGVTVHSTER